jgi:hypothetical protein
MDAGAMFAVPGAAYLLTLGAGVWLSRSGRPLNTAIFTIHKLAALAAVVSAAGQLRATLAGTEVQSLLLALIVLTAICVVILFASGAFLSRGRQADRTLLTIHKLTLALATIVIAAAFYLLAAA